MEQNQVKYSIYQIELPHALTCSAERTYVLYKVYCLLSALLKIAEIG